MSQLEKRLRALSSGSEMPWKKVESLLIRCGAMVEPPGRGSHYKVFFPGHPPLTIPVHGGRIKKIYAKKLADYVNECTQ